ncbi:MAG: NAD(P)-dependent oxidoreductase [Gemmatimonadota bacterium]
MRLLGWLRRKPRAPLEVTFGGSSPRPRRVLVTGAAGSVAGMVLPLLRDQAQRWRLTDSRDAMPSHLGEVRVQLLGMGMQSHGLFDDVDAVVHLAGQAKPAPVDVLRRRNVEVLEWLLEEMRAAGVRRLVYASSMHVMGGYSRFERVTLDRPPMPSDAYGASKIEAESRIRSAALQSPLDALVLRMGHVTTDVATAEPGNWLAADDLARLIVIGLTHPHLGVATVHAVTPHRGDDMGQAAFAAQYGMAWRTDAPRYRVAMRRLKQFYGADTLARTLRGGTFASGRA